MSRFCEKCVTGRKMDGLTQRGQINKHAGKGLIK